MWGVGEENKSLESFTLKCKYSNDKKSIQKTTKRNAEISWLKVKFINQDGDELDGSDEETGNIGSDFSVCSNSSESARYDDYSSDPTSTDEESEKPTKAPKKKALRKNPKKLAKAAGCSSSSAKIKPTNRGMEYNSSVFETEINPPVALLGKKKIASKKKTKQQAEAIKCSSSFTKIKPTNRGMECSPSASRTDSPVAFEIIFKEPKKFKVAEDAYFKHSAEQK